MKTLFTMLTDMSGVSAMIVMLHALFYKKFRDNYSDAIVKAVIILLFFAAVGAVGEELLS
jgi:uncharacterized membrane protein